MSYRVVRKSRNTGRTLKVLHTEPTRQLADAYLEGFGQRCESERTYVTVEYHLGRRTQLGRRPR